MEPDRIYLTAGRDYNHPLHGRCEYVIYRGEDVIARDTGFKSAAAARRAGLKAAQPFMADGES